MTKGELAITSETRDQAIDDVNAIRTVIRNLLSIVWSSVTTEGSSLFQDLLSVLRLSIADAAELVQEHAGRAKEGLRSVDKEVQQGQRDTLGRDKKRLEEEKDVKVAWEHGMDTVKDAGTTVIGTTQETSAAAQEKYSKASSRLQEAYDKVGN